MTELQEKVADLRRITTAHGIYSFPLLQGFIHITDDTSMAAVSRICGISDTYMLECCRTLETWRLIDRNFGRGRMGCRATYTESGEELLQQLAELLCQKNAT